MWLSNGNNRDRFIVITTLLWMKFQINSWPAIFELLCAHSPTTASFAEIKKFNYLDNHPPTREYICVPWEQGRDLIDNHHLHCSLLRGKRGEERGRGINIIPCISLIHTYCLCQELVTSPVVAVQGSGLNQKWINESCSSSKELRRQCRYRVEETTRYFNCVWPRLAAAAATAWPPFVIPSFACQSQHDTTP